MKNIFLYTGKGAYQAKDIENFLAVFEYDYSRVCEHDLDQMDVQDIFIVPGGRISDYLVVWGEDGVQRIRSFVERGGIYIGICAGAYVAGTKYEQTPGLAFVNEQFIRTEHHSVVDVTDATGKAYQLIAENGPLFSQEIEGTVLLADEAQKPQVIEISYGLGKVILFAAHPEGSVYDKKLPQDFSGAEFFIGLIQGLSGI